MVLDSKLPEHLAHFGIDMMTMEKARSLVRRCLFPANPRALLLKSLLPVCPQTERTMTELEIAVNQRVGEWEVIQESGTTLRPLSGPGLTGMRNLGNSCYLNSVMQVLFTVPDFESKSVPTFPCLFVFFLYFTFSSVNVNAPMFHSFSKSNIYRSSFLLRSGRRVFSAVFTHFFPHLPGWILKSCRISPLSD